MASFTVIKYNYLFFQFIKSSNIAWKEGNVLFNNNCYIIRVLYNNNR